MKKLDFNQLHTLQASGKCIYYNGRMLCRGPGGNYYE